MLRMFIGIYLIIFLPFTAMAEIYKNFKPLMTLAEIKNEYPNGTFSEVKAAWVTNDKGFYSLTGKGILGTIYIAFDKHDNFWVKVIDDYSSDIEKLNPENDAEKIQELTKAKENIKTFIERPLDQRYIISWVRWVPSEALPFERLESKYGKPESCGYSDEDFAPFCSWTSKGLTASLSDNKKFASFLDFNFTDREYDQARGIETPEVVEKIKPQKKAIPDKKKKL